MQQATTVGIDLAKNVFKLHDLDAEGAVVLKRKLRRREVPELFARRNT